jgi:hypothetical protein
VFVCHYWKYLHTTGGLQQLWVSCGFPAPQPIQVKNLALQMCCSGPASARGCMGLRCGVCRASVELRGQSSFAVSILTMAGASFSVRWEGDEDTRPGTTSQRDKRGPPDEAGER